MGMQNAQECISGGMMLFLLLRLGSLAPYIILEEESRPQTRMQFGKNSVLSCMGFLFYCLHLPQSFVTS